ncbi:MAG TPA: hypothetical protein VJL31_12940 [Gemmatimonadales bacterium]|nr:hypothetical protein [Gemmatimonadales bacterium]
MYYSGRTGLGFSLKPPAWLRKAVGGIWQKGTEGGVDIPLPGGGKGTLTPGGQRTTPGAFTLPGGAQMDMGMLALLGVALVGVMMISRRR